MKKKNTYPWPCIASRIECKILYMAYERLEDLAIAMPPAAIARAQGRSVSSFPLPYCSLLMVEAQ